MSILRSFARATILLSFAAANSGLASPALAQGGPSPSAAASVDPMAPSFFTGNAPVTGACRIADPTTEEHDGVISRRGESWGCLTWTTDDPRFSGVSTNALNQDEYTSGAASATGRVGSIVAGRERIVNADGAWEGTWTELDVGSFHEVAGWFVGEGAYAGLTAYVVISDALGTATVRGAISPRGRLEAPETIPER
jgi:hypothetical protein